MKAIEITQPYEVRLIDREVPVPQEGEALLKVLYCGICRRKRFYSIKL